MEPEQLKKLAELLGVDPLKLSMSLQELGKEEESPSPLMDNFYFNPNIFMKLHSIDYAGLRKLVVPNLKRLRR